MNAYVRVAFLYEVTFDNYRPDMPNTAFLVVFDRAVGTGMVLTTSSSVRETFQERKGKIFPFLVRRSRVNVP